MLDNSQVLIYLEAHLWINLNHLKYIASFCDNKHKKEQTKYLILVRERLYSHSETCPAQKGAEKPLSQEEVIILKPA